MKTCYSLCTTSLRRTGTMSKSLTEYRLVKIFRKLFYIYFPYHCPLFYPLIYPHLSIVFPSFKKVPKYYRKALKQRVTTACWWKWMDSIKNYNPSKKVYNTNPSDGDRYCRQRPEHQEYWYSNQLFKVSALRKGCQSTPTLPKMPAEDRSWYHILMVSHVW